MDGPVRLCRLLLVSVFAACFASACTAPRFDAATLPGKTAILDAVYSALNNKDCATAISTIEGVYGTSYSDNEVRLARASAFACKGGVEDLSALFMEIANNASALTGPAFWSFITQLFYDSSANVLDTRMAANLYATDALFAALKPGTVILSANRVNDDTPNVGSVIVDDRISDANLLLILVSMAQMGVIQSRYGNPDPATFAKGQVLGWEATNTDGWMVWDKIDDNGCDYAASVVNLFDAIGVISQQVEGSNGRNMAAIADTFGGLINDACDSACRGVNAVLGVNYGDVGCGGAAPAGFDLSSDYSCKGTASRPCQLLLRNRDICKATAAGNADVVRAKCAAAGVARFVSQSLVGWQ
jgi:hypothetical protein